LAAPEGHCLKQQHNALKGSPHVSIRDGIYVYAQGAGAFDTFGEKQIQG